MITKDYIFIDRKATIFIRFKAIGGNWLSQSKNKATRNLRNNYRFLPISIEEEKIAGAFDDSKTKIAKINYRYISYYYRLFIVIISACR